MKAFLLGILHVAIGGAVVPVLNLVAHGNFSATAIGTGAAIGAASSLTAYLTTAPKDQTTVQ